MNAYTIHDTKSGGWNFPFPSATRATAMRQMSHDLQKQDSLIRSYSEDFTLNETGVFDDQTGIILGLPEPVLICKLSDLVELDPE